MIIAIETSTEVCSAALVHQNSVLNVRSLKEKNIHSERLLTLIDELLHQSQISKTQLDGIAVSIGPGSFTGLRIGLSAAKGLALALDLAIIAVPTLDGIAEGFRLGKRTGYNEKFCAMIDAKRDEAFYSFYSITQDEIFRQQDFSIKLKTDILSDALLQSAITEQPEISASSVGRIADRKRNEFRILDFSHLEPLYLRDFVATLPKIKV